MAETQIGVQLYTLRDFCKTKEDFASTIEKVRKIGYGAAQLSGHGPIDPKDMRKILDDNGVVAAATHTGLDRIVNEADAFIEEHKTLGCEHTAIASLPKGYKTSEGYTRFAREASEAGRNLKEAGITLSYHNHAFELEKYDGRLGLEIIRDDSDPEIMNLELDTYWVQHGGGDPAAWIRSVKGRIPLLHVKDKTMRENECIFAEIGEGNLNWPEILAASKEAGVQWYLVEQDRCERDPFESVKISYDNMVAMGLK